MKEYKFSGSICGWDDSCRDDNDNPLHAYVCYDNNEDTVNLGKVVSIDEIGRGGGLR